jgi:CRISPR-associated endonuclease Csn1
MADVTLGLDLGPTSLGWALIDEQARQIVASAVRVFPEGVDRDQQGGEKSKTQTRRTARGMRRQIARRARRRRELRGVLMQHGLLPNNPAQLDECLQRNPYELRRRALDEPLTAHEIGRVLTHLNQRRGFLSNRKTDKARAKDTKGMLAEISGLASAIDEAKCRTLGEYLARLGDAFEHRVSPEPGRVRHRHTRRNMYEREFEEIWKSQRDHHPALLTDELRERVRRIIFFQRRMYWPKSVVGRCELEPKLKRCPRADRAAQRFRILQEVNNLRVLDRSSGEERCLTDPERATLVKYLAESRQRTFDQIRKKLGFTENVRFNLEGPERDKLKGHETDAALGARSALGKRWTGLVDEDKDRIVTILIEEEREDVALRRLTQDCGLTPDGAQRALGVSLPDGYVSLSHVAIDKLLPHLERGLLLMADDPSNSAIHAAGYLRPDERVVRQRDLLPPSPDVPNPIVRQALVEVRKLVNAVIREYGKPDRIHIELAREATRSFEQRRELRFELADRRKRREEAADKIVEQGDKPTGGKIQKYLLWQEQGQECIYSGRPISLAQLLSDAVNVDHILPRWRSLDDSMANKVLAFREENDGKGDRTPREWLEPSDPQKYEQVLQRTRRLPYNKQRKFLQKNIVLDDFVNRQLTDTAYISRLVMQYLKCLGVPIVTPRGQMTADLRHFWGLNTILDPEGRGEKNRADHRHHAIDAVVIALTDYKRLHALANDRGKDVKPPWGGFRDDVGRIVAAVNVSHRPLRRLHGALHEDTLYGATQKPAGQESVPAGGVRRPWAKGWVEDHKAFVHRKPITSIDNSADLAKVRDDTVRELLIDHLKRHAVLPADYQLYKAGKLQKHGVPKTAWKEAPRMPSGVPIRKVRMIEESETFRRVSDRRSYQFVKPGNNHHIVYRASGTADKEKWTAEVVTMWDAALRARNGQPIIDHSNNENGRFVMSLSIGETFEIDRPHGARAVCVVRKIDQRSKRIDYKLHTDARPASELNKDNLYLSPDKMRERNATKVTVDPLGRIRTARD